MEEDHETVGYERKGKTSLEPRCCTFPGPRVLVVHLPTVSCRCTQLIYLNLNITEFGDSIPHRQIVAVKEIEYVFTHNLHPTERTGDSTDRWSTPVSVQNKEGHGVVDRVSSGVGLKTYLYTYLLVYLLTCLQG